MRSQYSAARLRSCSTATTPVPSSASSRTRSKSSTWKRRSRKLAGSSSRRIGACWARARAKTIRWRSPDDSWSIGRAARCSAPQRSRAWRAIARSRADSKARPARWGCRPMTTTSSAVNGKSKRGSCGTTAMRRAISLRGRLRRSSPRDLHAARVAREHARDRAHQGALAGAVRPQEADDARPARA